MAEKETQNKKDNIQEIIFKLKKNPWIISTIILALASVILLILILNPSITGNVISEEGAGEKLVNYLNGRVGGGVEFVSSEDLGELYKIEVSYKGQEVPVYMTKDGKYLVQGVLSINQEIPQVQEKEQPQEVPKSDKPKVELFVMTYCPFGLQMEKGFLPVLELLGDKIDGKIRFVHYFMHGAKEQEETHRQVCIREEQGSKYINYLKCFIGEGNATKCLEETGINEQKLNECIDKRAEDYYAEDSNLSKEYGVRGSPTLVINGVIVSSGRSPAAVLSTVCSAFNQAPGECNEALESETPSSGFGYSSGGSGGGGSCG